MIQNQAAPGTLKSFGAWLLISAILVVPFFVLEWNDRKGVRFGVKIGQRADVALLNETLEFMKYAITQSDCGNAS